jgi:hypothetical protein
MNNLANNQSTLSPNTSAGPSNPSRQLAGAAPTTRRGKIARLPRPIRETLNRRLSDGEMAQPLLAWLNAQPEVQSVLNQQFEGRPITEQNLSEWRHGGYIDWEQKEALRESIREVVEDMDDLQIGQPQKSVAERFAELQALALGRLLMTAFAEPVSDRREQRILALVRSLNNVRRCDNDSERVRLKRERQQQIHVAKFKLPEEEAETRANARKHALWHECFRQEFNKTTEATHGAPAPVMATPTITPPTNGAPNSSSIPVPPLTQASKEADSKPIQVNPTKSEQSPAVEAPTPRAGEIRTVSPAVNLPGCGPILAARR